MNSAQTTAPKTKCRRGEIVPPRLHPDLSRDWTCYPAKEKDMTFLELPTERVENWEKRAVEKFAELLKKFKSLRVAMDTCVRCGACADKCPFYLGTGDPKNMPVARAELLRKVYRRYFTWTGRLFGKLAGAEPFSEELLQEWYAYFYQCSQCRRCSVYCPYGIDTAEITTAARSIMAEIGVATKYVTEVIHKCCTVGNNLGIPEAAWRDSSEFLEEEIEEETGLNVRLPVNEAGAEVLLVPPSADLFTNPDTMIGYAKLFHAAGISWTTSSYASEAGNFGLFLNYEQLKQVNKRIIDSARELGVKRIIWGECGHAWRAALFTETLNGPMDFLDVPYPVHICEFAADLIRRGALTFDKSANDDVVVTYHDPCNPARAGGLLEEPREVIRACVSNFIEMPANTIREKTFCCGAGGGLLADEIQNLRMAGGRPRAEACRYTGATYMATPCAICKAQLPGVMDYFKVDCEIGGVHDLLAKAIVLK